MPSRIALEINAQPDDSTCGPTCLHALYRFHDAPLPLERVIGEVPALENRGTLAVQLALHALRRGFDATIYTYNLQIFDPTWFELPPGSIPGKLRAQARVKRSRKLLVATKAYLEFLALGGRLEFHELTPELVRKHLKVGRPLLTGLSATYLYGCARETGGDRLDYDDVRGLATGHFVLLCGYDPETREVEVADPLLANPRFGAQRYRVGIQRVLGAILLGVLTYDANFLVLEPRHGTIA
jgi:hypothetical protein